MDKDSDFPELKWKLPVYTISQKTGCWYYWQNITRHGRGLRWQGYILMRSPNGPKTRASHPVPKACTCNTESGRFIQTDNPDLKRLVMLGKLEGVIHG